MSWTYVPEVGHPDKGNMIVQLSVGPLTNALVASRTDTVKANAAANRGIAVFTYPEFIAKFLRGVTIATGGKPVKYVDGVDKDLLVPDFTAGQALEALDVL